jgi:cytoplasmic iron level regulating protein YaaA (DUF328/UPF0246 family)
MLILLPPSETKRPGGVGISIDKAAIIWAALDEARDQLIAALEKLSKDSEAATKALKLGKNGTKELKKNLQLLSSPTMPALERYSGVLYDAIGYYSLSQAALERAHQKLFIQSALFGLVPAMEKIPDYRFSANSRIEGIDLRKLWVRAHEAVWPRMVGPILDMRSADYRELNPVPVDKDSYLLEVLSHDGKALNHFNKKAKGQFVRAALEIGLEGKSDLKKIAKSAGFRAELDGSLVRLFTTD